jgi:hypothetical protein
MERSVCGFIPSGRDSVSDKGVIDILSYLALNLGGVVKLSGAVGQYSYWW